ncbi:Rhodanese-like domain-containing protein [Sporodiniella umbellata]|nr:Rhodanese-like domain-containing protein [Sporodiniella umbellata]
MLSRRILSRTLLDCQRTVLKSSFTSSKLGVNGLHLSSAWVKGNEYSTAQGFKTATFEDIQQLIKNKNKNCVLLDVREYSEVEKGYIPTAKNVPLTQFGRAWKLSNEDFKETYGFDKPSHDVKMIPYCLKGVRSALAAEHLSSIGFTNIENYVGSYDDYLKKKSD